jgi:hypothetical protein
VLGQRVRVKPAGNLVELAAHDRELAAQHLGLLWREITQQAVELLDVTRRAGAQLDLELPAFLVGAIEQAAPQATELLDARVHAAVAVRVVDRGDRDRHGGFGRGAVRDGRRVVDEGDLSGVVEDTADVFA